MNAARLAFVLFVLGLLGCEPDRRFHFDSGTTVNPSLLVACAPGAQCEAPFLCIRGACRACAATACGGLCVDTATDERNCGACGNACPTTYRCRASACVAT